MKKILFILLLLSVMLLQADLENSEITVSSGNVNAGDSISISVSTTDLLGEWDVISFQFEIDFDPSAVTFSSYDIGDVFDNAGMLIMNEVEPGNIIAAYSYYEAQTGSGVIAWLNFFGIAGETVLHIHDFKFNATEIIDTTDGSITVIGVNELPVADAGEDMQANEGETIQLDGSSSYDPEGENLTYSWTAPEGITLSDAGSPLPEFTAPYVSEETELTFTLIVNDGIHNSLPDDVLVTVLDVVNINDIPSLIEEVAVYSISPNPFNPTTTISFLLPKGQTQAHISIYNAKGQLVRSYNLKRLAENSLQKVHWNGLDEDGKEAASGVYFCRVTSGSSEARARMLLLK